MNHLGTQVLETERLRLRPLALDDAEQMFANWASDAEVARYVTWAPHASSAETAELMAAWVKAYQTKTFYNWGIEVKETAQLIGTFSFVSVSERDYSAELGYCIGKTFWNQGYVTEAGQAILAFGFDRLGLHRIAAVHDVRNPASGRVMTKLGMSYEGTLRDVRMVKGVYVTVALYAKLALD